MRLLWVLWLVYVSLLLLTGICTSGLDKTWHEGWGGGIYERSVPGSSPRLTRTSAGPSVMALIAQHGVSKFQGLKSPLLSLFYLRCAHSQLTFRCDLYHIKGYCDRLTPENMTSLRKMSPRLWKTRVKYLKHFPLSFRLALFNSNAFPVSPPDVTQIFTLTALHFRDATFLMSTKDYFRLPI